MKRYMELICGPEEPHKLLSIASFHRSHSVPIATDSSKFSSSVPLFSSHPLKASSSSMSIVSSAEMPRDFHAERSDEIDSEPPIASSSSSSSSHNEHVKACKTLKTSRVSFSDMSMARRKYQRDLLRTDSADGDSLVLAAVDMGTNSFHIVVAEVNCDGDFQVLDSEKEHVRLGSGSTLSVIMPEAEARAFEAMKRFKMLACAYNASLRVVATAAVREAGNRGSFLSNMLEKVGVKIEVLSGREEACLIYRGVLQALPVYDKLVLVVDIGGGSTEVVVGVAGRPIYAASMKLGHLHLTDLYLGGGNDIIVKGQLDDVRKHARRVLRESGVIDSVRNAGFELAIGSSGTIETIEQIVNQEFAGDCATLLIAEQSQLGLCGFREREFTRDELAVVVRKLSKVKNNEQRAKVFGLPPKRAAVLVAGAVVLEEIFVALDIHKMRVSPYALREGVIVDTLSKTCKNYKFTPNVRWSSVVSLARRFYESHRLVSAAHSAHLALDILTGLRMNTISSGTDHVSEVVSLLDETDTELLEASVTLHAVGMCIGFRDYHKHSHYLIKNNDILVGYSPVEVKIMALLAKYHRKKIPSKRDEDFTHLSAEAQVKTRVLCAIIRVAVALNRCHTSAVKAVHVIHKSDECVLVIVPSEDPSTKRLHDVSLELWAAQDKLDLFEKVFKCKASIVVADHSDENAFKVDDLSDQLS
ncbi:hypothetical protein GOP47_0023614 [Adiantum capillus-veneris]|uniref:Exopolyphosphatase n=1 Tax=Adiantum capillus-veneris TaxID=13818 RepID=A0A9D4U606_ADICA|nr:hypothetical protein GOP47_0023614 [Adiantum capillus-veneris]